MDIINETDFKTDLARESKHLLLAQKRDEFSFGISGPVPDPGPCLLELPPQTVAVYMCSQSH